MNASLASGSRSSGVIEPKNGRLILLGLALFLGLLPRANAQAVIDLGNAASFAVLAGTSVTNSGSTTVNGNLGVSPGATATGFGPGLGIVNGTTYLGSGSLAGSAQASALTTYNVLTGETVTQVLTGQDLGTRTLAPGVYSFGAGAAPLTGTLVLDAGNNPNARFDFLIGSTLTTATGSQVTLTNGASANNVFWQVGTSATLGDASVFAGNIFANTSISLVGTGVAVDGRLFALNGTISLIGNTLTVPSAIPEPATNALIGAVAALGFALWHRRRAAS